MGWLDKFKKRKKVQNGTGLDNPEQDQAQIVDPEIVKAIAESEYINDDEKVQAALALQKEVENRGLSGAEKKTYIASGVALLAGAAMIYPNEAEAFCGGVQADFEEKIIDGLTEPFAEYVNNIFESFTGMFDQLTGAASSLLSSTTTSSADAQNKVTTAIAENQAKAAAAPPPDACGSDTSKERLLKSLGEKDPKVVSFNTLAQRASTADKPDSWSHYFEKIAADEQRVKSATNYGFTMRQKTDSDPSESDKYSNDFLLLAIGESYANRRSEELIKLQNQSQDKTDYGYNIQQDIAYNSTRQQIATLGLSTGKNARGSVQSPGILDSFDAEIQRTYSNSQWRDEIRGYADPTPAAIELALQLSFQNAIQLESIEALKVNNAVLGTTLMEMIDTGDSK